MVSPPTASKPSEEESPSAAEAAPTDAGTRFCEPEDPKPGDKPDGPFVPLSGWAEIFAALNESLQKKHWKSTESTRDKIRKFNTDHKGPIVFPEGKGKQPSVDKTALLKWWNELASQFDARILEAKSAAEAARIETNATHNYGATGTVVPGIGGSLKARRTTGKKGT